jgi:hypothetical protein
MRHLTLALLAATVALSPAQASHPEKVAGLEKAYANLHKQIVGRHVNGIMNLMTRDFQWVNPQGQVLDYAAFKKMMVSSMGAPIKFKRLVMKNDSYDFMGNEARVRTRTEVTVEMKGPDGKMMTMQSWSEGVDTWRWTKSGWRCSKVEVVHERFGG